MRKIMTGVLMVAAVASLTGCGGGRKGVTHRSGLDEYAVARRAPLVVPPDFALNPPQPGAPRPQEADSSTQALQAMFGGPAPRSAGESALLNAAGPNPEAGIRSAAGDPGTTVVDKGGATRDILNAPASTSPDASTTVSQ